MPDPRLDVTERDKQLTAVWWVDYCHAMADLGLREEMSKDYVAWCDNYGRSCT